jgi:hypothetical protein
MALVNYKPVELTCCEKSGQNVSFLKTALKVLDDIS